MIPSLEELGIDKLSVLERLELIGMIWDTLPESGPDFPVPDWHLAIIEERLRDAEQNPDDLLSWDEFHARLGRNP